MSRDDYQEVVERLTAHCKKAWIALPIPNTRYVEVNELSSCSPKRMKAWLEWIYPPVKVEKITVKELSTIEKRVAAFAGVVQLHRLLQMKKKS